MTGNANFATPNPTLTVLGTNITAATTKINAYNSALTASQTAMADGTRRWRRCGRRCRSWRRMWRTSAAGTR
jgi:hypothetical protein